jgi:hypothetical protein
MMMTRVNGNSSSGGYTVPNGAFGRQAAQAFINLQDTNPLAAAQQPIRYADTDYSDAYNQMSAVQNLMGFNDVVIRHFSNGKDTLQLGDFRRMMGIEGTPNPNNPYDQLGEKTARQWLGVSDLNKDGKVDLTEQSATTLVQEAPGFFIARTIRQYLPLIAQTGQQQEVAKLAQTAQTLEMLGGMPPDGVLSPEDRRLMDHAVESIPTFTKEAIRLAAQDLNLPAWAQYYRAQQRPTR